MPTTPASSIYTFVFDPVSIVHADRLRDFLNTYVLKRAYPGYELHRLTGEFRRAWDNGSIIAEGLNVRYSGSWVGSKWVLEVLEDEGEAELDEQMQGIEDGSSNAFLGDVASRKRRNALQKRKEERAAIATKKTVRRAKASRKR